MTSESELVKDVLNSYGSAKYRVDQPGENRLLLKQCAEWFVWSTGITESRAIGPLKAAWKDPDGGIWLETSKVDDMMSMVEREYGEKGIHVMPDAEPGVAPSGRIPDEVAKFPKVVSVLKACEDRVARASERSGIPVKVLYDGGAGVTTFRIGAKIESPSAEAETLKQQILANAKVLKEAYKEVGQVMSDDLSWIP